MYKADGLFTLLRLSITKNNPSQAAQIARLCAECGRISFRKYCFFIGRILLEDKFPQGSRYFQELNKLLKDNNNLQNTQQQFAEIAYSVANLETNSKAFEEAFVALHEFVYEDNFWINQTETTLPSLNEPIHLFIIKEQKRNKNLKILRTDMNAVKNSVLRNYDESNVFLHYEEIPADLTTINFSKDHVLVCMFESLLQKKQYNEKFKRNWLKDFINEHKIKSVLSKQIQNGELVYKNLFQKRKRTSSTDEVFNYLYPMATKNGAFQQAMKQYLASCGPKHYIALSPLQHLRRLARCKILRWKDVINVHNVTYALNYISFNEESWTVQLLAPSNVDKNANVQSYPLLGAKFKVKYPTHEAPNSIQFCEIPNAKHCKEVLCFIKSRTSGEFRYFYKFEQDIGSEVSFNVKFLACDDVCCSFLKLLVFRFYKGYRTTLKDIQFREHNESYILYSCNNNTLKKPNRRHPDIWHQLLHYDDLRNRTGSQSAQEIHKDLSKKTKSPILNIIDRLQEFLSNKGHKNQHGEYFPFFLYLKHNFKDINYTGKYGLWHRLIASLDVKNRKWNLVSRHVEYINDEFNRVNV